LKDECEECENSSLAAVVSAQDENEILDADDENERPEHQ
jgi:hypothetical protein